MEWNPLHWFSRKPADTAPAVRAVDAGLSPRSLAGGRATIDSEADIYASAFQVLSPLLNEGEWRSGGLDSKLLDRMPLSKLVKLLANNSPHVSKALWDFLRYCNPGHETKAYKSGGKADEKVVDDRAQQALDDFTGQLHGPFTANNVVPFDVIIAAMYISIFLRGALLSELVLNKTGTMPLEIATPDPATLVARRIMDEERGLVWQIGQRQRNKIFVPIDKPTVSYVPIDPLPGEWQGRALAAPAVFSCLFLIGLLHDLRRVVAQQGYPRIDLEVISEKLLAMMPPNLKSDPSKAKAWVDQCENEIKAAYAALQPDDAYVHLDVTKVNRPVGTLDASSLKGCDGLIAALERFTVQSLKTMAFMLSINESTTETLANRQFDAYLAGISTIQHVVENTLQKQLTLALRVQGIQADVQMRFASLRGSERLRDAQANSLEIDNARKLYDNGTISADEMAMRSCGKAKADAAAPRAAMTSASNDVKTTQPDPGANRALPDELLQRVSANRAEVERVLAAIEAKESEGDLIHTGGL
jgi:hypothetical protein